MCLRYTMTLPETKSKMAMFWNKGHCHKVIETGVISKGSLSGVCMLNIVFILKMIYLLWFKGYSEV